MHLLVLPSKPVRLLVRIKIMRNNKTTKQHNNKTTKPQNNKTTTQKGTLIVDVIIVPFHIAQGVGSERLRGERGKA